MNAQSPNVAPGLSQEKLYAAAHKAMQHAVEDPAQKDNPGRVVAQQMSGLNWQEVEGGKGQKSFDLERGDVVYLSAISPLLSQERVESPTAPKPVNFKDRAVQALRKKIGELYGDTFSHNFFVAELAKMGVGIVRFSLSKLGLSHEEISQVLASAKKEKIAAVDTGIKQVASEKVLFGIVTGARVV